MSPNDRASQERQVAGDGVPGFDAPSSQTPTRGERPFFPIRMVWWTFVVSVTAAPFVLSAYGATGKGWGHSVERGELILVALTLMAATGAGTARLTTTRSPGRRIWRQVIVAGSLLLCIFTALFYADARNAITPAETVHKQQIIRSNIETSSWVFLSLALIFGVGAEYLSHVEEVAGGRWQDE